MYSTYIPCTYYLFIIIRNILPVCAVFAYFYLWPLWYCSDILLYYTLVTAVIEIIRPSRNCITPFPWHMAVITGAGACLGTSRYLHWYPEPAAAIISCCRINGLPNLHTFSADICHPSAEYCRCLQGLIQIYTSYWSFPTSIAIKIQYRYIIIILTLLQTRVFEI